jgi:hypothetical protein
LKREKIVETIFSTPRLISGGKSVVFAACPSA